MSAAIRYDDEQIGFSFPRGYVVHATTDQGRFYYELRRPRRRLPVVTIEVTQSEADALAIETMLRRFDPLGTPLVRQVVHRRGAIETPRFHGLELWTSTEKAKDRRRRTSEWTALLDAGDAWVHLVCVCDGDLDKALWSRVLDSIELHWSRGASAGN